MAASSSAAAVRSWRTAFLTLRDETLTSPPSVTQLVQSLIFSHPHSSFISAASDLPAHEVTSDLLFLIQLVANASEFQQDLIPIFSNTCHLIHDVSRRVSLDINSSSWTLLLDSSTKMMDIFLAKATSNAALYKPVLECLETLRYLVSVNQRKYSLSDDIKLANFLLHIIACLHVGLISLYRPSGNQKSSIEMGKKQPRYGNLWEVQTAAFTMLGEVYSRNGSSFAVDIWQSTIQVSGFVASLRTFFVYGLTGGPQLMCAAVGCKEKESGAGILELTSEQPKRTTNTPYRPPHLRKKDRSNMKQAKAQDPSCSSDHDISTIDVTSSDSDYSDNDGSLKDINSSRCTKVRVSAIVCIQVAAISCLTAALSVSPSIQVKEMILEEASTGFVGADKKSGILFTLLQLSERLSNPTICFEALQALRAVSHNYPDLMLVCWGKVSAIVHKYLREATADVPTKTWKEQAENSAPFVGEKIVTAAIKVLDECLRAISGFRGTEDLSDEKLLDTPFTSDSIRTKKVSSAPSYGSEGLEDTKEDRDTFPSGIEQWAETIEKQMPLILWHTSAMVSTNTSLLGFGKHLAPSVFSILLLLLRDSSNFKIRIQAAAALAVPASALDYGKSFPDVVQGLEHVVENLGSDQILGPSSFKYRIALENQKASFLEDWFKRLCSSVRETSAQSEIESDSLGNQKKEMISRAIQSLIAVYEDQIPRSL
ncbi:hypothetical protein COLO4_10863 [Corchorus olitorius]|uniref:Armadillo-like helical n=1 Tax=Corchorus olitorius TaxID=93759 RepID=A0A1R3K6S7_9ROSI|nr:hypothetical protein COLO4_10863 [Corchorus olitorius]